METGRRRTSPPKVGIVSYFAVLVLYVLSVISVNIMLRMVTSVNFLGIVIIKLTFTFLGHSGVNQLGGVFVSGEKEKIY